MRNAIKEFLELTSSEKDEVFKSATIIFDTNVFLNLYRYSNATRDALLDIMKSLKNRMWMPYQVAREYMKNRPEVIFDVVNKYDKMITDGKKLVNDFANYLRIKNDDEPCQELLGSITEWINERKEKNLIVTNCNDDSILNFILDLFESKVGTKPDKSILEEIKKEGKERYAKKIPPGYKDAGKICGDDDNNAFGDLIFWKEVLAYAKENSVDIVLVTSDQKEDWWNKIKEKTIGPHPELRKEFFEETGRNILMYEMNNFIKIFKDKNGHLYDESVLDEVQLVQNSQNDADIPMDIALIAMGLNPGYFYSKNAEIERLKEKNRKRRNSLIKLENKIRKHQASPQDIIAYEGNKYNLERDEIRINQIENELINVYNDLK